MKLTHILKLTKSIKKGPRPSSATRAPIQTIADYYGVSVHLYADDTQLYLPFSLASPSFAQDAVAKMEQCIRHISCWMIANKLQLNEDKTELLVISSPKQRHKVQVSSLLVNDTLVTASSSAKNLGVIFDQELNMKDHVTNICKNTNFHLRQIGRIRKYLTRSSAKAIVHALITSRLDNNNSLLYGLLDCEIKRLQRVQNNAARIVTRSKRREHITPVLRSLHWLPISSRIVFKILLLTFKAINGNAPSYLSALLVSYHPALQLRSSDSGSLTVPKTKLATYGDHTLQLSTSTSSCFTSCINF